VLDDTPPGHPPRHDPASIHSPTPDSTLDPERASRTFPDLRRGSKRTTPAEFYPYPIPRRRPTRPLNSLQALGSRRDMGSSHDQNATCCGKRKFDWASEGSWKVSNRRVRWRPQLESTTSNPCSPRPFSTTLTPDLPSCNSGRRPIHYHLGRDGTSFSTTTQQGPLRASYPEAPEPKGTTRLAHPSLFPGASALRRPRPRDAVRSTHARDKTWIARRRRQTRQEQPSP
jgi:hypothetical protein